MQKRRRPWFNRYDELSARINSLRSDFERRCEELQIPQALVKRGIWKDIIAKAVHESNWQEGVFLDEERTRELEEQAYEELSDIKGPHIDLDAIVDEHRKRVSRLIRHLSAEEVAAYNLSAAHHLIFLLVLELHQRKIAALTGRLRSIVKRKDEIIASIPVIQKRERASVRRDLTSLEEYLSSELEEETLPIYRITEKFGSGREYIEKLLEVDYDDLVKPFHVDYIHALHRIAMAGILPRNKAGQFRKRPASVGNFVQLPAPVFIPELMAEFCLDFPTLSGREANYDPIMTAAGFSYRFVAIHPYSDGNGRVSRLLMNLILRSRDFPPVYLKADSQGRNRYSFALKRANRGSIKELAALIALSAIEVYEHLNTSISRVKTSE